MLAVDNMAQAQVQDAAIVPQTADDLLESTIDQVFGPEPSIDLTTDNVQIEVDRLLNSAGLGGEATESSGEPSAKKMIMDYESTSTTELGASGNGSEAPEPEDEDVWYLNRFSQSTPYIINSEGYYAIGVNG